MRTVKVTLTDAMYEAACEHARHQGSARGNDPGIATVVRGLLRSELSRRRYSSMILDMNDEDYENQKTIDSKGVETPHRAI